MRIAPIGALFGAGDVELLREAVEAAVYCTHTHPLGIDGAVCQARAIGLVTKVVSETIPLSPEWVFSALHEAVRCDEFHHALEILADLLRTPHVTPPQVVARLGHGIAALEAVPAALYAFLSHPASFEEAVVYAIGLGGDTDTIGAMAGALSGAYHGAAQIPARWLDALEDGKYGKTYIMDLAQELSRLFLS
jgi:poly(ADP-ribose) glycohydrolase ARH3